MKFENFICFEASVAQLHSKTRDEVIEELVHSLEKCGKLKQDKTKNIIKSIIKRENEASTGLGRGVAIPHVKHKAVSKVIASVGLSEEGIDFLSLDKMPVHSIILLISPLDNPDIHLQAMENIFKHLQIEKFRKFLRQCNNQEQIKDLFLEADDDPSL